MGAMVVDSSGLRLSGLRLSAVRVTVVRVTVVRVTVVRVTVVSHYYLSVDVIEGKATSSSCKSYHEKQNLNPNITLLKV